MPAQNNREKAVVCNDYEKLSFAKFIKCICNHDLSVLIESGIPTPNQLFMAWMTILSSYYVLINSKEQLKYIKRVAKMEQLNLKIRVVTALCESLSSWYDERICDCLRKPTKESGWGYTRFKFSPESVLDDIARVLVFLQTDNMKLEKEKKTFEDEQKEKKKTGEAPTRNAYMKTLYAIEKFRGQRYKPDEITVYEYGMFQNEIIEYNEMMRQETEKNSYRVKKR